MTLPLDTMPNTFGKASYMYRLRPNSHARQGASKGDPDGGGRLKLLPACLTNYPTHARSTVTRLQGTGTVNLRRTLQINISDLDPFQRVGPNERNLSLLELVQVMSEEMLADLLLT